MLLFQLFGEFAANSKLTFKIRLHTADNKHAIAHWRASCSHTRGSTTLAHCASHVASPPRSKTAASISLRTRDCRGKPWKRSARPAASCSAVEKCSPVFPSWSSSERQG